MALTFLVGALPFLFIASAHAQEMSQTQEVYAQETQIQEAEKKTSQTNPWLDDYNTPDGYVNAAGDTIMAYSSYAEISYTQALPYGLSLYGAFGITPWRSCYTQYELGFAVQNIEVRMRKDWSLHKRLGLMLQGVFTCSPSMMAADKTTTEWHPKSPGRQAINANLALGISLK